MNRLLVLGLIVLGIFLLVGYLQTAAAPAKPHPKNYARPDQFNTKPCVTNWAHSPLQDVPLFKNFSSSVPAEVHLRG